MKTDDYNLIEEDWIPVLLKDGSHRCVSLGEVFKSGEQIADLAMVAYERVSVMRLLVCIAMAAMDEKDLADEPAWREARTKIPDAVAAYFEKWHDRFNFYGPHAFMQPDGLTLLSTKSKVDKLVIAFSSGNNGTLFDHEALAKDRTIPHGLRVLSMLAYQSFSAGGTSSQCRWDGIETQKSLEGTLSKSLDAAPLREKNMIHTFLCGENILETVWLNLLTSELITTLPTNERGRPIWEYPDLKRETLAREHAERSVMGRLVPLSRVMKIEKESNAILLGEGLKYPKLPEARVFEAAVRTRMVKKNEEEKTYVSLSLDEAPWRNLHAILARREDYGSLVLDHLGSAVGDTFTIWSGGLLTDGKGKDIAALEWRFTCPLAARNEFWLNVYENGIADADQWAKTNLFTAAKTYCEKMKIEGTGGVLKGARAIFWDALEREQPKLMRIASEEGDRTEWERIVAATAKKAFERACPHQTGRQLAAYVQALGKLTFKKKEDKAK